MNYFKESYLQTPEEYNGRMPFYLTYPMTNVYQTEKEYERDKAKGLPIERPFSYFSDPTETKINMCWSSTANLFYNNWLNFVYQTTPYRFET